jgi:hypothetical protein
MYASCQNSLPVQRLNECCVATTRGTMAANPERFTDFGRRIDVFWDLDAVYYRGTIIGFNPNTGKHHILYDDNTSEQYKLESTKYR